MIWLIWCVYIYIILYYRYVYVCIYGFAGEAIPIYPTIPLDCHHLHKTTMQSLYCWTNPYIIPIVPISYYIIESMIVIEVETKIHGLWTKGPPASPRKLPADKRGPAPPFGTSGAAPSRRCTSPLRTGSQPWLTQNGPETNPCCVVFLDLVKWQVLTNCNANPALII